MAVHLFKKMAFSLAYQKSIIPVSNEITDMILSYVKQKTNGRPLEMAVDVGCGTGRYTLPLAPHFKKVLGLDISDSQISVANQVALANNVSYMVAAAENLPLKDASVDLVHASLATHWFTIDKFVKEAVRVLKTGGCFATHAFFPFFVLEYKHLSYDLTGVMKEAWDILFKHLDNSVNTMFCQYRNVYEAIPLKDKEHITDISLKFPMFVPEVIGFIESFYMYQDFKEKDLKQAEKFLKQIEERLREILGEEADSACMNMYMKYYCVLACKQ
ncbi:putative methyltransferase isoform 2-T3 [Anomaloglossus baeobatrachus]|uniref:putative methyltransferase DDB_G0268948 n=1 Tax=Anomaloglossus baeobatrachus TaxID=238106 RepID=UPI003F5076E9